MSKSKVSGVGTRYGAIFPLDADGLPLPAVSTAVPMQGTLIEGIKGMTVTDPETRNIAHVGEDRVYAQDSLPAITVGTFGFNTSKVDLDLEAMVEGGTVRTINSNKVYGYNTNKAGSEPQMLTHIYRQALDTDKNSSSFGKLRQWESRFIMSSRISNTTGPFEAENPDTTYQGVASPARYAPWFEQFTEANWGFTEAEGLKQVTDYQPRLNMWRGNGTLTSFQLSHAPVTSSELTVWVDGTQTTPSSVNTTVANPAFTLGAAAANNKLVFALIETQNPGSN